MTSTRRWADMVDDGSEARSITVPHVTCTLEDTSLQQLEVDLWNWDSFQGDYVATRCRLTLLTAVHSLVWQTTLISAQEISCFSG